MDAPPHRAERYASSRTDDALQHILDDLAFAQAMSAPGSRTSALIAAYSAAAGAETHRRDATDAR